MLITENDIAIFRALHPETLDGGQWKPGHWLARDVGRNYLNEMDARLSQLTKEGYIRRNRPDLKKSKHSAWARTAKADEYLQEKFGEALPKRSKTPFEHQILDDMDTASIRYGLESYPQLKLKMLPPLETPFEYDGGNRPMKLGSARQHLFLFKEVERNTHTGTTWREKLRAFKKFQAMKTKYGIDHFFIRVLTVSSSQRLLLLKLIKEELGDCWWIGVAEWKDWGNHDPNDERFQSSYPKPDGYTFNVAYERQGYPAMYLNRFWEC